MLIRACILLVILLYPFSEAELKTTNYSVSGATNVCKDQCYTYEVLPAPHGTTLEWTVEDHLGNSVSFTISDDGQSIEICFPEYNEYIISAGEDILPLRVFVGEFTQVDLIITSPVTCMEQTGQCMEVCAGSEVTFSLKDFVPDFITWNIGGDGEIVSSDNSNITIRFFDSTGSVWISYFGNVNQECFFEGGSCVELVLPPEAGFKTEPAAINDTITICSGQSIEFTNTSTSDNVQWFAGNGGSGEGNIFSTSFQSGGSYTVSQRVFSACACEDVLSVVINVLDATTPQIYCTGTVCVGDTAVYRSDINCSPYAWQVLGNGTVIAGGGSDDDFIEVVWNGGASGIIELSNGCHTMCPAPTREVIYILGEESRISGPVRICSGKTYNYSVLPYDGSVFDWSISPGGVVISGRETSQISARFSSGNPNPFVAISIEDCTRGCTQQDTLWLELVQPFDISGVGVLCPGEIGQWEAFSGAIPVLANWQVFTSAGSLVYSSPAPSSIFTYDALSPGNYRLLATPENDLYCNQSTSLSFTVNRNLPAIDMITGPDIICPGEYYTYTLESADTISFYFQWEIDRGGVVSIQYGTSIRIAWEDLDGQFLRVSVFDPLSGCAGDVQELFVSRLTDIELLGDAVVCNFDEVIYSLGISPVSNVSWSISPPSIGVILDHPDNNSARIKWQGAGTAQLESKYCGLHVVEDITILGDFEPDVVYPNALCAGETVVLSTVNAYLDYQWYRDGQLICNTTTCESGPGRFLLIVTSDEGCNGRIRFKIDSIAGPPLEIIPLGFLGFCVGESVHLTLSTDPSPDYDYTWYLDGVAVGNDPTTLIANDFGRYVLEAIHIATGCRFFSNELTTCNFCNSGQNCLQCPCGGGQTPVCDLSLGVLNPVISPSGNFCNEFTMIVTNPDIIPSTVRWAIYDGGVLNILNGLPATYTFQNIGIKSIIVYGSILNVAGDTVNLCPIISNITIDGVANFLYNIECQDLPVEFLSNLTLRAGVTALGYQWDFGDPMSGGDNISNAQNPNHVFTSGGNFIVTLTVETSLGCFIRHSKNLIIPDLPDATFSVTDPLCTSTPLQTTSIQSDGFFSWYFDGLNYPDSLNDIFNPGSYRYVTPGNYRIVLEYEDYRGCFNSSSQDVVIHGFNGMVEIVSDKAFPLCLGDWATLSTLTGTYDYLWSTGETTFEITALQTGPYSVSVTDENGCNENAGPFEVVYHPEPDARIIGQIIGGVSFFEGDTLTACYGSSVVLLAFGSELNRTFTWSGGQTTQTIRFDNAENNILQPGLYTYTVEVTDIHTGCSKTSEPFYVRIHPLPEMPTLQTLPSGVLCAGTSVQIFVTNVSASNSYLWNTGDVGTEITKDIAGLYSVAAQNTYGCVVESENIIINPQPNINFSPKGCFEACEQMVLCLPVPSGTTVTSWQMDGVSLPIPADLRNIIITESGTYTATIVNASGCSSTIDPITVEIQTITGNLTGLVFLDKNRDGVYLPPDSLLGGVSVYLWQSGMLLDSFITLTNGQYVFNDLAPGDYTIIIDGSGFPEDWIINDDVISLMLDPCLDSLTVSPFIVFECTDEPVSFEYTLCDGDVFELHGASYFEDTLLTIEMIIGGCSLTEIYDIRFLPESDTVHVFENACMGSELFLHGNNITRDTAFTVTLSDISGCDSILLVDVSFNELLEKSVNLRYCPGDAVSFYGETFEADTSFSILINGGDCDTLFSVNISGYDMWSLDYASLESCPQQSTGSLTLELNHTDWSQIQRMEINGIEHTVDSTLNALAAGTHTILLEDIHGCIVEVDAIIEQSQPLEAFVPDLVMPCASTGDSLSITIVSGFVDSSQIIWEGEHYGMHYFVTQPGIYRVDISNACETRQLQGRVLPDLDEDGVKYYVPNAFTPNNDEINDYFLPLFNPNVSFIAYHFEIFDRWGNKLFETEDPNSGWDGNIRNRRGSIAVYVWKLVAQVEFCDQIFEIKDYGDVTLYDR